MVNFSFVTPAKAGVQKRKTGNNYRLFHSNKNQMIHGFVTDNKYMQRALELAHHAADIDEVPIGAVLVRDNEILSEAWNQPINDHDPTAHAEILALRKAGLSQQNYRLPKTILYVTLEPCLMCYGALINARVGRLVYGASDKRFGVTQQLGSLNFNHKIEITAGVLEDDCAAILSAFFEQKRKV